jgi:hypothetical protein
MIHAAVWYVNYKAKSGIMHLSKQNIENLSFRGYPVVNQLSILMVLQKNLTVEAHIKAV